MKTSLETKPINTQTASEPVFNNSSIDNAVTETEIPLESAPVIDHEKLVQGLHQDKLIQEELKSLKDKKESASNPLIDLYTKHEEKIKPAAINGSMLGIGLHGIAAAAPFLNLLPNSVKAVSDKTATFYSRFLSGVPMAIFSLSKFRDKNSIQGIGNLITAASFPLINTVENMPIASSLFCGINTAFEAIEKYPGADKVTRKSDSIMHQLEEFAINYKKTWQHSAEEIKKVNSVWEKNLDTYVI